MPRVAALVVAFAVLGGVARAETTAQWQPLPRWDHQQIAWAAGRVWLFSESPSGDTLIAESARVANGRLSGSWVTTRLPGAWEYRTIIGSALILGTPGGPGGLHGPLLRALRLLPDGRLGPPDQLGGAPPPASSAGSTVVQLPERAVQLTGDALGISAIRPGACCDVNGQPVDYSSFVSRGGVQALLGVDRRGRLWLAWAPRRPSWQQQVRMVELDPATLRPRGEPAVLAPYGYATIVDLACSETCRVVFSAVIRRRGFFKVSWAPGDASPTQLKLPTSRNGIIAARAVADHLDVAYWTSTLNGVLTSVGVARGDERGRRLRVATKIAAPKGVGNTQGTPRGLFGPGGFFAFSLHGNARTGAPVVRVAILPVPR